MKSLIILFIVTVSLSSAANNPSFQMKCDEAYGKDIQLTIDKDSGSEEYKFKIEINGVVWKDEVATFSTSFGGPLEMQHNENEEPRGRPVSKDAMINTNFRLLFDQTYSVGNLDYHSALNILFYVSPVPAQLIEFDNCKTQTL